jgi:undecaprenyl-diphosphatase
MSLQSRHVFGALTLALAALSASPADAQEPTKEADQHFTIDPVADIVLTGTAAGAAGLTELILSTGEIVPQQPSRNVTLLPIDRGAVTQTVDPNAGLFSDIGLGTALTFAALDSIASGFRDGKDAALVDAVMYAQSLSITLWVTDVTKIAVRRPRPIDYQNPSPSDTNMTLSFFSGHASLAAAATATASYLAFVRAPRSPRPWITLGAGALLTAFVSYERVRSGAHFPTDVIAGSMAGAAIGVLVPHFHLQREEHPAIWIGAAPSAGGGAVSVQGVF